MTEPDLPLHGRHAAPAHRRALLLPSVLLLAAGTAFGGLAVLPAAAADAPRGVAGSVQQARPVDEAAARPVAPNARLLRALERGVTEVQAVEERRTAAVRASRERRAAAPAAPAAPVPPEFVRPGTGRVTSTYGPRWGRLHAGLDLAAGTGAPISAASRGTVVSAGTEGGYGQVVRVDHGDGTLTVYAHLSQIRVTVGQAVTPGQLLGLEGNSGHSTGPHLHFEVRVDGVPVDPAAWLRARGVAV